jgi:hypothetical protein
MTPTDLRSVLGRLGVSHSGAARLLGVDYRTMRRWLSGELEMPETVVRLLALLERYPEAVGVLRDIPRQPRVSGLPADLGGDIAKTPSR